jgi:hypothetical protein
MPKKLIQVKEEKDRIQNKFEDQEEELKRENH